MPTLTAPLKSVSDDKKGLIFKVNPRGLALVSEVGTEKVHAFTFDKIEGYQGQPLRELKLFSPKGLKVGCQVVFSLNDESLIESVSPAPKP